MGARISSSMPNSGQGGKRMDPSGGGLEVIMNLMRRIGLLRRCSMDELSPQCALFQYDEPEIILCETLAKNLYAIGVLQTFIMRFGKGCL